MPASAHARAPPVMAVATTMVSSTTVAVPRMALLTTGIARPNEARRSLAVALVDDRTEGRTAVIFDMVNTSRLSMVVAYVPLLVGTTGLSLVG